MAHRHTKRYSGVYVDNGSSQIKEFLCESLMERYESLGLVGEGSYGTVLKCRHRDSGRLVAIKKFMDSDDDKMVKKIALREIKMLRQLRHDNLVNLLEVWKRRRRWYLVFEFVERTLLDDLEANPNGLDLDTSRQYLYQILRAAAFCHEQHVVHRDIKPENILISQGGVVKLCDFGFARTVTSPSEGGVYTDYVATRWYRAPELLVGDTKYGKPVDVWAVGCLLIEMLTGQPLFPGDSDLDQIYHIVRCFGNLTAHHQELFYRNPVFSGVKLPECSDRVPLVQRFPTVTTTALDLAQSCLQIDPDRRAQCSELLEHPLFTQDSFHIRVLEEVNAKIQKDHRENSTLPKIAKTSRHDEGDDKNLRGRDKKQSECMDEKVNKEKEKRDKEGEEEKTPKPKCKQPSKLLKTIWNTSEPLMPTKESKTSGAKIIDSAAKTTIVMRSKPVKATGAEPKKKPEVSKPTKTLTSKSLEVSKTATDLKNNNTKMAKLKHQEVGSQVPKLSTCSTTDNPDESLSPKLSVKSNVIQKTGKMSSKEYPEGSATMVTSQTSNSCQAETSVTVKTLQPSSNDVMDIASQTLSSVTKPCKTTATSEHQTNCLNMETEQRRTSECTKVLPLSPKPWNSTSNFVLKMTKNNTSLSNSPSETLTSDRPMQSTRVCIDSSPAHSTTILPKRNLQTGSSSDNKPTNGTICVPGKFSKSLPTEREFTEVCVTTKNKQDHCNTSDKDFKEDHFCLKISLVTKTAANHREMSDGSGEDFKRNPESSEPGSFSQQGSSKSKNTTESITASTSLQSQILSDRENHDGVRHSVPSKATTVTLVNQTSKFSGSSNVEQKNNSSDDEPNSKSFRISQNKSLIREPKIKLGSLSNHTKATTAVTLKTRFSTKARNQRDTLERKNTTNVSIVADSSSFTSTLTLDHKTSIRTSGFYNMDKTGVNEFDLSSAHVSPPPSPPPPPSSSPTLLPPSSTLLIASSVAGTNIPAVSDHLTLGTGFHLGSQSFRCAEKPRHHCSIYSQLPQQSVCSHIPGPLTAQGSEKSLPCERSFLSDCCNHGNNDGITVTRKKSDIHLPDLRSSVLPELRGREGKHNKSSYKDQRKDKQPTPSIPPSEPQRQGHSRTDSHSP